MVQKENIVKNAKKLKSDLMLESLDIKGLNGKEKEDMRGVVKAVIGTTLFVLIENQVHNFS